MEKRERIRKRAAMVRAIRAWFEAAEFEEVETPALVPAPGMEPHIRAFETELHPESGGAPKRLYLHTSPEYAMKRLLASGWSRIWQLCKVFRDGEIARQHNPEFTMLEFYRAPADYTAIMRDLESLLASVARAVLGEARLPAREGRAPVELGLKYERLTVADAFRKHASVELPLELLARPGAEGAAAAALAEQARACGIPVTARRFEDVFFQVFLTAVEPRLGTPRPTFLVEWPACMAALARLKPGDPTVAERFELYIDGVELANGFSELNDAQEQRRRLEREQQERRAAGRPVYPLDERFLEAVGRMPDSAGVAVGVDRLAMLLTGAQELADVLLFPARELFG